MWKEEEEASQARPAALRRAPATAVVAVIGLGALALTSAGCGSSDEPHAANEPSAKERAAERRAELTAGGRTQRQSPANPAPKGSTPFVKEIYRQFPPPEPEPGVKGAAAAIRAGERACSGRTPVEVKDAFFPVAVEQGALDPDSGEARMIARVDKFENRIAEEPSFTSGQLAAGAYAATLAPKLATSGFQGCIYAMAKELELRVSGPPE